MGIIQRINGFLNYKIEINMEKRISRNKSLVIVAIFVLCLAGAGYYIGEHWFWVNNTNYYEYEMGNLEKKLSDNPESSNTKSEIAMTAYLNGDTTKAIDMLKSILEKEPQHKMATLNLGLIYAEQKQYKESISLLSAFVKSNQGMESKLPYLYLGQSYLALGKYKEAEDCLQKSLVRDAGNPVTYYYLGQTYEKKGDKKQAINYYEKALGINGSYAEANQALDTLLKKGAK